MIKQSHSHLIWLIFILISKYLHNIFIKQGYTNTEVIILKKVDYAKLAQERRKKYPALALKVLKRALKFR
jgi:hypothetical protein